jgi:hypothetical protein
LAWAIAVPRQYRRGAFLKTPQSGQSGAVNCAKDAYNTGACGQ